MVEGFPSFMIQVKNKISFVANRTNNFDDAFIIPFKNIDNYVCFCYLRISYLTFADMTKSNEVRVLTHRIGLLEKTLAEMVDINHAISLQRQIHLHLKKTIANFNNDYEKSKRQHPLPSKETEMLALFNSIDSGIAFKQLVYNKHGIPVDYLIFDVNPQFEKTLCLDRESVVGQLASEIYLTNPLPYLDHYIEAVNTGKTVNFKTFYAPTGKKLHISVIPLRGKRFATIFQDITND